MGLSVARALLKRGISVSLFEQATIPNEAGSSGDDHRLIRYPYGTYTQYMHMVSDAYEAWDRLWKDLQVTHYTETGTLVVSTDTSGWAMESLIRLREGGYPLKRLQAAQLTDSVPFLRTEGIGLAYYLASGGVLYARRILAALKDYLVTHGVHIHEQSKIGLIDTQHGQLETVEGVRYEADHVVITAGPWIPDLLPDFASRVTPSRQQVLYFKIPEADRTSWQQSPMILEIGPESGFYLVPPRAGLGLKVGDHRFSLEGHPDDEVLPSPSLDISVLTHRIPALGAYAVDRVKTCFYTVEEEERFIAKPIDGTWVLTGFSGHGFKFGPLIGERFADMLIGAADMQVFIRWLAGQDGVGFHV